MKSHNLYRWILLSILSGTMHLSMFAQNVTDMKGLKQGLWIETEGAYTSKGRYIDNQKDGTWIFYFAENKMLFKVESYKRGMKDGIFLELSKRSTLVSEQYFVNGLADGTHRMFSTSGLPISENNYRLGKLDGIQITYYENTMNKQSEEAMYKDGAKDGPSKWYDMQGNLIAEYNYIKGALEGDQKTFYPGGKIRSIDAFVNNRNHGNAVEYFENGNVKLTGQYVEGEKDGKWLEYDEGGKVINTVSYSKGKIK